jgi:hypothetical protein
MGDKPVVTGAPAGERWPVRNIEAGRIEVPGFDSTGFAEGMTP